MATTRAKHPCKTETCGSIWYAKDYAIQQGKAVPVWKCVNCNYTEPRTIRQSKWIDEILKEAQ